MKYNFYPFIDGEDYELVLVKDNKAVIKMKTSYMRAPYNGYVVFPTKDIPKDWWGNYNAGALQYLDIHGGITYCEVYNNDEPELREKIYKQIQKVRSVIGIDWQEKWKETRKLELKASKKIGSLNNSYVVFGFDCAHSGDEENTRLRDPKYIMMLTEKMEDHLVKYSKIYDEWKKMNREEQIKIIEKITGQIKINELGFGAMIDILTEGKSFKKGGEKLGSNGLGKIIKKD